jgi:uncharacterized protein (DUF2336 family)
LSQPGDCIVTRFLDRIPAASAGERAAAAGALARACLHPDLSPDNRDAAESAMISLLDDPSPLVRRAVAAAIAEVGSAEACLVAIENPGADVAPSSIARIIDRFGHLGAIREALFGRPDLPLAARQSLVRQLSGAVADFVADRNWLARDRAEEVGREACEKATVTMAALHPDHDTGTLIRHLRASGQLTTGLILRALLSGNMAMFEGALAELAGLPLRRAQALIRDGGKAGCRAVFDEAGLPASSCVAFREVLKATGEAHDDSEFVGAGRLKRRMVERALMRCERSDIGDVEPLMILLRRFATEAAREDASVNCERLVAEDGMERGRAA